uniref:GBD/FH3 domain-containing protein n=1 Tax=Caenorhabditis tropicalis TaxID=1561998 RepID=A0A1I7U550_9PELO
MGNYADQLTNDDGIKALVNLTFHTNPEIQLQYLRLIPLIAENNGPIQSTIAHSPLFPSFLTELSTFSEMKPANLMALIAAISSICRGGGRTVWKKFVDLGGIEKVFEVVEGVEDAKSGGKAAHLFYSIHTSSDREDLEPHRETLEEYLKKTNEELVKRQGKKENESKEANDFVEETRKKISQLITTFKKEDPKKQQKEDKKKKTEKLLMLK